METSNSKIARLVILIIASFLIFFFLLWLYHYLSYGTLVVTSDSPRTDINIIAPNGIAAKGNSVAQAKGTLSKELKAGSYFVEVQNGFNGASKLIEVKAHSVTRVNLSLPKPSGVEPVVFATAQDVSASSSQLAYLNTGKQTVNFIDSQNNLSSIDAGVYDLKSIKWSDPTFGVGQSSTGSLYAILNGTIQPISIPVELSSSSPFAVSPNRTIFVGSGYDVYEGTYNGKFNEIYAADSQNYSLLAGNNCVGVINSGQEGGAQSAPSLTSICSANKPKSTNFNTLLNGWSDWSPGDKYILVLSADSGEVLDPSLNKVAAIPQANITNPVWVNDRTIVFSVNSQLWSYNVQDSSSQLIANMPLGDTVQQITVSSDGSYIYLTTVSGSGDIAIRRVGLKGQAVPSYIYNLQDILPLTSAGPGFGLSLINFSGTPVIQVINYPGVPTNTVQQAQQLLQSDGFDISQFNFVTTNSD